MMGNLDTSERPTLLSLSATPRVDTPISPTIASLPRFFDRSHVPFRLKDKRLACSEQTTLHELSSTPDSDHEMEKTPFGPRQLSR